jgi:YD repeat-containing protein
MPLQIRRGTEAERQLLATTPQQGELIYVTDEQQLYIGDGATLLRDLTPVTGYTNENAIDAVGSVLTASTHTGITYTYNDELNTISSTVSQPQLLQNLSLNGFDITGTGNITVTGNVTVQGLLTADFQGTIVGDDSTILVDAVDNKVNLDGTVKGNAVPNLTATYDIGSGSLKFKDIYGTSLYLGAAQVTATGSAINLPAGSTVGGVSIMSGAESVLTDIQGSVFADDSTLLVDAVAGKLTTGVISLQTNTVSFNTAELVFGNEELATNAQVVFESTSADTNIVLRTITNGSSSGGIQFATSRTGINGSEAVVQVNDPLGFQIAQGWDGSDHIISSIISQRVDPNGSVGSNAVTGEINLFTFTDGNIANSKGVIINRNGYVSINKTSSEAQATLDINGFAKLAPLAAAPGTVVNGLIAIDDGTTNWSGHASGVQAVVAYINTGWVKLNN